MTRGNKDAAFVAVKPRKKGPRQTDYPLDAQWKFLNKGVKTGNYKGRAGYAAKAKGIKKEEIERGMARTYVPEKLQARFNNLMKPLMSADVGNMDRKGLEAYVCSLFDKFNEEYLAPLKRAAEQETVSPGMILSGIRQLPRYRGILRLSDQVHQDLVSRISGIRDAYSREDVSPELRQWMDGVAEYFTGEKWQTEKTILSIMEKEAEKDVQTKKKEEEEGEEKKYKITEREYTGEAFELRHGDFFMPADMIFQVNVFKDLSASGAVNSVTITDFSSDGLFGTFKEHDKETPPHMTYTSLGKFFQGGILVFPDYFGRLIETLHYENDDDSSSGGMRERFLEFLQKGVIDVVSDGTTFRMEAPRMIIGSANENPFLYTDGFFRFYDDGLADRIELINVAHAVENTAPVRQGTIGFIYSRAKEFNANGDGFKIEISAEATDLLLRESLLQDSVAFLAYRSFGKRVDEVMRYARRNRHKTVTLEILRELNGELFQDVRFANIDMDYKSPTGYKSLPQKQKGFVNGLSLALVHVGGEHEITARRNSIASYIVESGEPLPLLQDRFVLVEEAKGLSGEMMNKGYVLAADFVKNLIFRLRGENGKKSGWQLKTELYGNWLGADGPSGSNAAAASMVSALAGDGVYRNRLLTGTLQPETEEVGRIGGVYYKAFVPTRLKTLLERDGESEDIYFIFPAANRPELKEYALTDPTGIESKIASIPVQDFWQSYYLLASGPSVTEADIEQIEQRSRQKQEETLEKMRQRLSELDQ